MLVSDHLSTNLLGSHGSLNDLRVVGVGKENNYHNLIVFLEGLWPLFAPIFQNTKFKGPSLFLERGHLATYAKLEH